MASTIQARPQVGIERLPTAGLRRSSNEQREAMNCKSCRKRKIKCNRLRPKCEACKIFQCPCLYDAVPKKRGPKTEVLESLLKRVDELEKKLPHEKKSNSASASSSRDANKRAQSAAVPPPLNTSVKNSETVFSPLSESGSKSSDVFIDAYFLRVHDKPFRILDEPTVRQQHHLGQLSAALRLAIYAVSARLVNQPNGYTAAVRVSEEYAGQARAQVDADEPSIEALQTLLLVHRAYFALGKGRKAYMIQAAATSMCLALDLHREAPANSRLTPVERNLRRHLFWTCYFIDRFNACGTKRPSLISDEAIILRLPSWTHHLGAPPVEGELFSMQMNFQHHPETGQIAYGSIAMLIDIARILGSTNRYLANGGVKGDTHFPWHASSALSRLRHELDFWVSGNRDLFVDLGAILLRADIVTLLLSKLIYHVIHCLIYRPFLPVDLAELQGSGQHQSWQIEATNLCFLHANAIIETCLLSKQTSSVEWPSFIGYCLATAGTVHVHGVHYRGQEREVYSMSADFLSQEMQMLSDLRYKWAGVQHQKETLQKVYLCHSDLVKSLASNPLRFSPVFHLEDFFDRYPGNTFDGAHFTLADITVEAPQTTNIAPEDPRTKNPILGRGLPQQQQQDAGQSTDFQPNVQPIPGVLQQTLMHQDTTDSAIALSTIGPLDDQQSQFGHLSTSPIVQEPSLNPLPTPPILSSTFPPQTYQFAEAPLSLDHSQLFPFSPDTPAHLNLNATGDVIQGVGTNPIDPALQQPVMTPSGLSQNGSNHMVEEKDPFLTLLEQLAENENSRGGPSDLDFFLGEQNG